MSSIGILFSFPDNNSFWGSVTSRGSGDYDVGADARSKFREKSDHNRRSGSSQAAVNPNSSNIFTQQNYQHNRSDHYFCWVWFHKNSFGLPVLSAPNPR